MQGALAAWIGERLGGGPWTVASAHRSTEGFSWETHALELTDGTQTRGFIVHRVPRAGLMRPYEPGTLFALRRAVAGHVPAVPMPATLWLDAAGEATGRPLYVVERVEGEVPTQWTSDAFFGTEAARAAVADQLMGIAAALHAAPVDLAPPGLTGAGDHDPLAHLRRWEAVYLDEELGPEPVLDWGFAWLHAHAGDVSGRIALLHGDLRTGNYIVRDGRIVALLDWEDAHVGDPVQDLAHCAFRMFRGRTRMPSGLVPLDDLLARYEAAAGWAVPRAAFHFWTVFEAVYTTVTMHRAAAIFAAGETDDVRYAALGTQAHHNHRFVLDAIEAAERGEAPR